MVTCGNILGGGSSVNFMMYTRASASDYDAWNTEGWGFQDLLPLLKKVILTTRRQREMTSRFFEKVFDSRRRGITQRRDARHMATKVPSTSLTAARALPSQMIIFKPGTNTLESKLRTTSMISGP
jgi:choline dehydrogenase-like flavoprotein